MRPAPKAQWKMVFPLHSNLEFGIFVTFLPYCGSRDSLVVTGGGNRSTQQKPPPNPKSLATFSHALAGLRTQALVRDSLQSVAAPSSAFQTRSRHVRKLSVTWVRAMVFPVYSSFLKHQQLTDQHVASTFRQICHWKTCLNCGSYQENTSLESMTA